MAEIAPVAARRVAEADRALAAPAESEARSRGGPLRRETGARPAQALTRLAVLVLLAVVYFLAGKLGLRLAVVHPSASSVWAPTGIALVGILWLGYRAWPGIFAGALLVNLTTAGSVATSLGIATGNTLEALLGAYLVNRFAGGRHAFNRAPDTFRFAILAGMVSTALSASFGVTSLALGGYARWSDYVPIWLTWWLGDLGGALVVAPLLILWLNDHHVRWTRAQFIEASLLLISLVAVAQAVFGWSFTAGIKGHPLAFLCMPLLVWAAFRFDPRFASTAILVLSTIAVAGTVRGIRPAEPTELNLSLVVLQVFMGVAAVTTLALAAVVAERRRVERAVRATSEELRGALTELEAFSHSISHDLRSPVGAVLNYLELLEEDARSRQSETSMQLVRRSRASAESAAQLLDQLVQFGRVGSEGGERDPIDMTALARDVHAELVSGGEDTGDLHVEFGELPPARGSAALLRCVFRNLLSNAVKYTRGRAERRIQVGGRAGSQENTYCVADNGIGFDPSLGHTVFEPYRRLTGAQRFEGSGIGLTIAAKIVRQHGGRIWAESDGASGSKFYFTLPVGEAPHESASPDPIRRAEGLPVAAGASGGRAAVR